MDDPYDQFTEEDHAQMGAWIDAVSGLSPDPVPDDPGRRCECEDAPCCGH